LEVVAAKPIAATVGAATASACFDEAVRLKGGSVEPLSLRRSMFDN
jgi:hypothetical protein